MIILIPKVIPLLLRDRIVTKSWSMADTVLTPGMDNTRLFYSFTAVAGTVWIRLPANLQAQHSLVKYWKRG